MKMLVRPKHPLYPSQRVLTVYIKYKLNYIITIYEQMEQYTYRVPIGNRFTHAAIVSTNSVGCLKFTEWQTLPHARSALTYINKMRPQYDDGHIDSEFKDISVKSNYCTKLYYTVRSNGAIHAMSDLNLAYDCVVDILFELKKDDNFFLHKKTNEHVCVHGRMT